MDWQALRARFVLDHWPVFSPFVEGHNQQRDGPLARRLIALEQEGCILCLNPSRDSFTVLTSFGVAAPNEATNIYLLQFQLLR